MHIELQDVRKSFGRQTVLRGIRLSLEPLERVALIGPNGSGKSTLLRIILGMLRCEGMVRVDDRCPFEHRSEIAAKLGYVPQVAPQLSAPVRDWVSAIALLRGISTTRVAELAFELGLNLREIENKAFRSLSGGMKQKLLLAIAFSSEVRLLILDEPTASLDARARERCLELLEERSKFAAIILCSHRYEDFQSLVRRVVELQEGRVVRDFSAVGARVVPSTRRHEGEL